MHDSDSEELPPATPRRVAILDDGVSGSQLAASPEVAPQTQMSPQRVTHAALDAIEEQAGAEWEAMRGRINASVDPGIGARERILDVVVAALRDACPGIQCSSTTLGVCLRSLRPGDRSKFHDRWSRFLYDPDAVGQEYNLHLLPPGTSLKDHIGQCVEQFYMDLLKPGSSMDPLQAQRDTPLLAVAPTEIAEVCQRLAIGGGGFQGMGT